jgi:hypothetical protein
VTQSAAAASHGAVPSSRTIRRDEACPGASLDVDLPVLLVLDTIIATPDAGRPATRSVFGVSAPGPADEREHGQIQRRHEGHENRSPARDRATDDLGPRHAQDDEIHR